MDKGSIVKINFSIWGHRVEQVTLAIIIANLYSADTLRTSVAEGERMRERRNLLFTSLHNVRA